MIHLNEPQREINVHSLISCILNSDDCFSDTFVQFKNSTVLKTTEQLLTSTTSETSSNTSTANSTTTSLKSMTISTKTLNEWFETSLAKDKPLTKCDKANAKKCKGKKYWTGSWPSTLELPENQRRDTACPYTFKNETRERKKRWPDLIGIGAPKCGTGPL